MLGYVLSSTDDTTATASAEDTPANELNPEQDIIRLREKYNNDDIIGYLRIDGTTIDYPVVQTVNNRHYLDYNIKNEFDLAGWIFLDFENEISGSDRNFIIYGRSMQYNHRFHMLHYYKDYNFFREHSIVRFDTIYGEHEWEVFSFFRAHINFPYIEIFDENTEYWRWMLSQMKEKSIHDTNVHVHGDDRVLLLSTGTEDRDPNYRYVLGARRID